MTEIEFKALAAQGYNRIPLVAETYADLDTPLGIYPVSYTHLTPPEVRFRTEAEEKARHEGNKLTKRLARETTRALSDYNMIEAGDRVMVCLSGGKDSYAMLDILRCV